MSPELLTLINVPRSDGKTSSNVQIRGPRPVGMADLRLAIRIIEGRMFNPATNEAIVSTAVPRGSRA